MQRERSGSNSPTTSYKSNGVDDALSPAPPDEAPSTPTPSSPSNDRRGRMSDPTATSLIADEDKEEAAAHDESGTSTSIGHCGEVENQQKATVTGMICRKSQAFMFGQILSLFLVSLSWV